MISADDGTVEKLKQVIHTVTYSYSVAQEAAREVVKRDKYEDDDRVNTLEFSPPWVYNFFKYYHFRHRRISTEIKDHPSLQEIHDTSTLTYARTS